MTHTFILKSALFFGKSALFRCFFTQNWSTTPVILFTGEGCLLRGVLLRGGVPGPGGGVPAPGGPGPSRGVSGGDTPGRLLLRTVRSLLECILFLGRSWRECFYFCWRNVSSSPESSPVARSREDGEINERDDRQKQERRSSSHSVSRFLLNL